MTSNSVNESDKEEITEVLKFELELAKIKYDSEIRREDSVIQQGSRMQSVFSFMLTAVAVVATILSNNSGVVPFKLSIGIIASIVFGLLVSLILATMTQSRRKQELWANVDEQNNNIESNEEAFRDANTRIKYLVELYARHQKSLTDNNRARVNLVIWSMRTLYFTIGLCVLWFVVVMIII